MFVMCQMQPLPVKFELPRKRSYNELSVPNIPVPENITQYTYYIRLHVSTYKQHMWALIFILALL